MRLLHLLLIIPLAAGCMDPDDPAADTQDPVDDSGKGDGPSDLTAPMCGGTEIHTSAIADRRLTAPPVNGPVTVLDKLGVGWAGSVSFELFANGCTDINHHVNYTQWVIKDGNGTTFSVIGGGQSFAALKLPVTITAPGISGAPTSGCSPSAEVKNIRFETIGTSCLPARVMRQRFNWPLDPIGKDMQPTMMTFTAKIQFYANYTAPQCGRVMLAGGSDGVYLTPAKPQTPALFRLRSPIRIYTDPQCASSRLPNPEATDADFKLTFTPIALGDPLSPI